MRHAIIEHGKAMPNVTTSSGLSASNASDTWASADYSNRSSWPFNLCDVSPLQWWRTMPADHLGSTQHQLLYATIEKVVVISELERLAVLRGDAATRIAIALGTLPITELTFEVDVVMSALTANALGGDSAAILVLSHILRLAPLDHPFAKELSISWLARNLHHALSARITSGATSPKVETRHPLAFHAGDHS